MVEEAANPRSYQSGLRRLRQGQLAHSLRYMARAWNWKEPRVRRFLSRLKNGGALSIEISDAGNDAVSDAASDAPSVARATVITLCNYERYLSGLSVPSRVSDAASDALSDAGNDAKKESLEKIGGGVGGGTRAREANASEVEVFACELAAIAGYDPDRVPPSWVAAQPALRVQYWIDNGWRIDTMRAAARAVMTQRRGDPPSSVRYFEKIFARAHAPLLPLAGKPTEVPRATAQGANSDWRARRDAQHDARAELKAFLNAERTPADGGGGDRPAFRLVSDG